MWAYPLVHDLLAENDDERERAKVLIVNFLDHIMANEYLLVYLFFKFYKIIQFKKKKIY